MTIRYLLLIALVLAAAALTIWIAMVWASAGAPVWQAALGPVLLAVYLLVRMRNKAP
ncbi:MAG: hypothetical protein OEX14_09985 [Paracoccaceae bacterium]|jgi:hypothetical protein|nr:hypothetical protein [Paracoccaceae bacterium]